MKRKILFVSLLASLVTAAIAYEEFSEGLSINMEAVPLAFTETDNGGAGSQWRVPLDRGSSAPSESLGVDDRAIANS